MTRYRISIWVCGGVEEKGGVVSLWYPAERSPSPAVLANLFPRSYLAPSQPPFSIINQITPTKLSFSCVIEIVFLLLSPPPPPTQPLLFLLSSRAFLEHVSSCSSLAASWGVSRGKRVESRGLVIQRQWHQVNDLIFSIKIKEHSPRWPAGQRGTSKRRRS